METLLSTACLLQLSSVVTACCTFLSRQLHPSNCLGFALFAEQQNCNSLMKVAMDFTCQNFSNVCRNQEFFQLNPDQLSKLLASDDLNILSEQEVFEALVTWVQHDTETRNEHVPDLLSLIRLPLLQPAVSCYYYYLFVSQVQYLSLSFRDRKLKTKKRTTAIRMEIKTNQAFFDRFSSFPLSVHCRSRRSTLWIDRMSALALRSPHLASPSRATLPYLHSAHSSP